MSKKSEILQYLDDDTAGGYLGMEMALVVQGADDVLEIDRKTTQISDAAVSS